MTDTDLALTPIDEIGPIVAGARAAFDSGRTRPVEWRMRAIERLRDLVVARTDDFVTALGRDLGRCRIETLLSEIAAVASESDHALAHLPDWVRPTRVPTPVATLPGSSRIIYEPLGVAGVIAPWNYPVNLSFGPRHRPQSRPATPWCSSPPSWRRPRARVIEAVVDDLADPAVTVVQGGVAETTELLEQRFDHILYTGGGRVGRVVMRAAAEHLTPVTLELGGKSPAIVTSHGQDRCGRSPPRLGQVRQRRADLHRP